MDGTQTQVTGVEEGRVVTAPATQVAARRELLRALVVLVMLMGVASGVLFSMAMRERRLKVGAMAENQDLRKLVALAESRQGEILSFLARPGTELVKLTGVQEWTGQGLTVAWNPTQRRAMVLIERLPAPADGTAYRLRAVSPGGRASPLGVINPASPTSTLYTVGTEVDGPSWFDVAMDSAGGGEGGGRVVFAPVRDDTSAGRI